MEITPSSNEEPVYFANFGKKVPDRKGVFFWRPASILVSVVKRDGCDFLHVILAVGTRSAELPRVVGGETARRRDGETPRWRVLRHKVTYLRKFT